MNVQPIVQVSDIKGSAGFTYSIDYISLSLVPQDPRGLPTNCGTHGVNSWYMII